MYRQLDLVIDIGITQSPQSSNCNSLGMNHQSLYIILKYGNPDIKQFLQLINQLISYVKWLQRVDCWFLSVYFTTKDIYE